MISINSVTKRYNQLTAVDNLTLEIKRNEIFGIIGLSGAGKSTLVRLINRLEESDNGSIYIDNRDITSSSNSELREMRKKIGMIFQNFNLLSSRDVKGNISYPLEIAGWKRKDVDERVVELLKLVGLSDKRDSRISTLSGGQKQRVAIARALANHPDILLCDEATSALDPQTTKSILNLIKNIQKELGLTVVLITHQMEVIKEICHRVALMDRGQIVENSTVEDIFSNPKTQMAKEFVEHIRKDSRDYMEFFKYQHSEGAKLLKLHFNRENAGKPVINDLIKSNSATINILSGDLIKLTSSSIGELVIEVKGNKKEIDSVNDYLGERGIKYEVINE